MKTTMTKQVAVEAKTLKIHLKVSDRFCCEVLDQDGRSLKDHEGYVPDFMPGEHYGDYVILDIDIDSGQITNWKVPTTEQMREFLKSQDDE